MEEQAGRSISEPQLLQALDDRELIETIAQRVKTMGLSHCIAKGSCLNIDGWTARKGNDGYYRLYKTVYGKTESIYLGKRMDWEKARRKITKKEKKLGLTW